MTYLVLGAVALLAGLAALWFMKATASATAPARRAATTPPRSGPPAAQPSAHAAARPAVPTSVVELPASPPMPVELAQCRLLHPDTLPPARRLALVDSLRNIPRPPLSLHKLLSEDALERANSAQLSELITGEALIAAKVLATVNSPFYGLQRPVVSIGQSVTYLGLNTVRSICLQYLLDESFKVDSAETRRTLDTVLAASACASELCAKLAQRLDLPEPGALVTQVVLSFLGHLAAASLMPQAGALWRTDIGWLERTRAQEAALGLAAVELGGLLMQAWGLPSSIVDEVRDIDRMVVTPVSAIEGQRAARLALCCLCARLGEDLALGTLRDLTTFDPAEQTQPEYFLLRQHLAAPRLARLVEFLRSPEIANSVRLMRGALAARR